VRGPPGRGRTTPGRERVGSSVAGLPWNLASASLGGAGAGPAPEEVDEVEADVGLAVREEKPANGEKGCGTAACAAAEGASRRREVHGPLVLEPAEGDVERRGDQRRPRGEAGLPPEDHERGRESGEKKSRQNAVQDEEPVEGEGGRRERREEAGSPGRHPVEEDVRGDAEAGDGHEAQAPGPARRRAPLAGAARSRHDARRPITTAQRGRRTKECVSPRWWSM